MKSNIKVIEDNTLTKGYDKRYVVIDTDTGKLLDNAQGYGYKSIQKAYAAYSYKTRDKSKDKEREEKTKIIKKWMKEHKDFVELMNNISLEIAKGSWGPDDKFNTKFVQDMIKENNLSINFKVSELLKVWEKGHL